MDKLPREVLEKRIGAREMPITSGPDGPGKIVHPSFWAKAVLTGDPYPIRAQITSANNQILRDQDSKDRRKGAQEIGILCHHGSFYDTDFRIFRYRSAGGFLA